MFRASGTEPIVRIYSEAANAQRVKRLLDSGRQLALRILGACKIGTPKAAAACHKDSITLGISLRAVRPRVGRCNYKPAVANRVNLSCTS
jgi:hypothetical protein